MSTIEVSPGGLLRPGIASSRRRPQRPFARLRTVFAAHPAGLPVIATHDRMTGIEQELLRITNQHRATLTGQSAAQLAVSEVLDGIADWKGDDCADGPDLHDAYFSHDQPAVNGHPAFTIWERFSEGGWSPYYAAGENIAYGLQSAQAMFDAFMSDLGHRQNLEGPWNVCGFAVVEAANALLFCVQDFGYIPGPQPPPPGPTPPPRVETPKPGEKWRRKGKPHAPVLTIDARTTATVVWFVNPQGQAAHKRLSVFLDLYERIPVAR